KWLCFTTVALGTAAAYSDASMVNIALPSIGRYFDADISVVEAIITFYLLMLTGLVIIFGRLADMYGRKRLYNLGFVIFILASALCGIAPSFWLLVALRSLQGVGAAMLLANGSAIVTASFPKTERGKALGMLGSVIATSVIAGPIISGVLSEYLGWRAVFYVNVPVVIIGLLLSLRVLPADSTGQDKERFDVKGAIAFLAFLGCFMLLLKTASVAALAGVVLLVAGFIIIESRVAHPLLDIALFRNRAFGAASVSSFLSFWATAATSFLIPFYLERVLVLSPKTSGYIFAPIALFLVIFAPLGGRLADRFGTRAICTIGALINCIGLLLLSTLGPDTSPLGVILRMIPFGIGSGLFQPPNNSSMMGAVPPNRLGIASGMISAVKNFGSMSGVAVTSLVFGLVHAGALERLQATGLAPEDIERQAFLSGLRLMFLISAAICSIAVITSFVRGEEKTHAGQEAPAAAKIGYETKQPAR
ncbi:MAG TPA: MFS transporter, partial [Blastocatellia bacterium]|nr:MFS transporter [Blastocatellia bacterium]